MNLQQIEALAVYFTGDAVARQSISLGLPPGTSQQVAQEFFAARAALCITGYATKEEAIARIELADRHE